MPAERSAKQTDRYKQQSMEPVHRTVKRNKKAWKGINNEIYIYRNRYSFDNKYCYSMHQPLYKRKIRTNSRTS